MSKPAAILIVAIPLTLLFAASGTYNIIQHRKNENLKQTCYAQHDRLDAANENAVNASATETQLRADLAAAQELAAEKSAHLAAAASELTTRRATTIEANQQAETAQAAARNAQAAAAQAQARLQQAEFRGKENDALHAQLAEYQKLGTPAQIRIQIAELSKPRPASAETQPSAIPATPAKVRGEIATIQQHNTIHDFYVIDAGSDNGLSKGDKFIIVRQGKAVGRIEISRTQPALSIATIDRALPRPPIPFKPGDAVLDSNRK